MPISWSEIPLTLAAKAAVRTYYRGICQYCSAHNANDVEHIIPLAMGGDNVLGNATLACSKCNTRKGTMPLDEMFVAIAHARAKEAAPTIAAMLLNPPQSRPEGWRWTAEEENWLRLAYTKLINEHSGKQKCQRAAELETMIRRLNDTFGSNRSRTSVRQKLIYMRQKDPSLGILFPEHNKG